MGKCGCQRKLTVEECIELDISELVQADVLKGSAGKPWFLRWTRGKQLLKGITCVVESGGEKVRILYTVVNEVSREIDHMDYQVGIVKTPCHFGGFRRWFLCPFPKEGKQCGRRVGKLYLPPGRKCFGCRQCYNLAYESQRENRGIPKDIWKFLSNIK